MLNQEAQEVLQDSEGRWLSFAIKGADQIILEKKGLPAHVAKLDNVDLAVSLESLIMDLQDAGEVPRLNMVKSSLGLKHTDLKVFQNLLKTPICFKPAWGFHSLSSKVKIDVSHHKLQDDQWSCTKPLVFVLDAAQEPQQTTGKKKKVKGQKGGVQINAKNFGSWMSITKVKTCGETLKLAWRCRLLGCQLWVNKYSPVHGFCYGFLSDIQYMVP